MSVSPIRSRVSMGGTAPVRISLPVALQGQSEGSREKITEYYTQLHLQVQQLDSKVEAILAKHEVDFMSAFKVHIFGLQKQLLDLRHQLQEKESSLYKDQQIQSLHNTVKWFHEEGVKFAEILTKSKQETEKWKTKAQALEADANFLERQVKMLKRKQRLCEQMRDHSQTSKAEPSEKELRLASTKSTSPVRSMEIDLKSISHPAVAELINKYDLREANLCRDLDELAKTLANKSAEAIRHLQAALDRKTKKLHILTAQQTQQMAAQSEYQRIFLECVEEVRRENGQRTATSISEQLLAMDRRRIVELFCLNDAVFQDIYEKVFPPFTAMKSTPTLPKMKATGELSDRAMNSPRKGAFAALFREKLSRR